MVDMIRCVKSSFNEDIFINGKSDFFWIDHNIWNLINNKIRPGLFPANKYSKT